MDENDVKSIEYQGLGVKMKFRLFILLLKEVFAKNESGYRLNAVKKSFWSLLILLLSVVSTLFGMRRLYRFSPYRRNR